MLTQGTVMGTHTYSAVGTYTVSVTITDDEGLATTTSLTVKVADNVTPNVGWLPTIDFETDAYGTPLQAGDVIAEQWSAWGVHVTTGNPAHHPAMIFDSANPTGEDTDLGTPHQSFGGPGYGSGGAAGTAGENSQPLHNVLIVSEDADSSDPDDNASGGSLIFTFDSPTMVDDLYLLDVDTNETATIDLYAADGSLIDRTTVNGLGNNAAQKVQIDALDVSRLEVHFPRSGAVSQIVFCRDGVPGDTVTIGGNGSLDEGSSYTLNLTSVGFAATSWSINWGDGSIETVAGDPTSITHTYADGDAAYDLYAWATNGAQVHLANPFSVSVDNVAPTLTIAGVDTLETGQTYTLDLASTDPGEDTIQSWTIDWGDGAIQTVTGNPDSVTHTYASPSTYTIQATARDEDSPLGGIAESGGLVVVDAEAFTGSAPGTGKAASSLWTSVNDPSVAGGTYVIASPNDGVNTRGDAIGPRLDYAIDFQTTGTYYVWVRILGASGADNSVHVGLDGTAVTQGQYGVADGSGDWRWKQKVGGPNGAQIAIVDVDSPGLHTLNLWMREDGVRVDKLLLTTDPNLTPSDLGPDPTLATANSYASNPLTVDVTPGSTPDGWLPNIDFERDTSGRSLAAGTKITDQFAAMGVHITTHDPVRHPAMIFDSSRPTGGDFDLGTPNEAYGGPGGQPAEGYSPSTPGTLLNDTPLENVLIISEDADSSDPDDNLPGGTFLFTFDQPTMVDEIGLLDIDTFATVRVSLYRADGSLIGHTQVAGLGNNSVQRLVLDAVDVSRMDVRFSGLGAITDVMFCRDGGPIPTPSTRFFVPDTLSDQLYRYGADGGAVGDFNTARVPVARGATSTASGNPVWVLNGNGRVVVYDSAGETQIGEWTATGLSKPQGIATDGTDIWIVDKDLDCVFHFPGAASRLSGTQAPTSNFELPYGNRDASGITTDGTHLWVVDRVSDKVFVYDRAGNSVNWWGLDPANRHPTGLTINPAGGDGIWVVDNRDDRVYEYAQATLTHQSTQSATRSFALAAGNTNPQGIADPSAPINIGDSITDSIGVAGEVDDWTFDAVAGDEVYFDFTSLSGGRLFFTLVRPDGSTAILDNSTSPFGLDNGPRTLSQTGPYTIRLNSTATDTPDYAFTLFAVPGPDVTTASIDGPAVSGSVDIPGSVDEITFSGTAGQQIFIDFQALSGGTTFSRLFDPSGNRIVSNVGLSSRNHDEGPLVLPETGTYTLQIDGQVGNTPSYTFQLFDVPDPDTATLVYNVPFEGSIEVPGAVDELTFSGTAGEVIYVDFTSFSGSGSFIRTLTDPDGNILESGINSSISTADAGPFTLGVTGTYSLTIDGDQSSTLDYGVQVLRAIDVGSGQIQRGTLEGFSSAALFRFDASAGDPLTFNVIDNPTNKTRFDLIRPSGSTQFTNQSSTQSIASLPETGPYLILADGANASFIFTLEGSTTPTTFTPADLTVTTLNAPSRIISDTPSVDVSWTTANIGPGSTSLGAGDTGGDTWQERVIFSSDATIGNADDVVVGSFTHTGPLGPGATSPRSETINLPAGFSGEFFVAVVTNARGEIWEGDLSNGNAGNNRLVTATPVSIHPTTPPSDPGLTLDLADGTRLPVGQPITISGSTKLNPGDGNIIFVVDVSSSVLDQTGLDANQDGLINAADDLNGDGSVGDILDAEIGAIQTIAARLRADNANARLAVVPFAGDAITLDAGPDDFVQTFVDAGADADNDNAFDLNTALQSLFSTLSSSGATLFTSHSVGSGTDFEAALTEVDSLLDRAPDSNRDRVFFFTDGDASAPDPSVVSSLAGRGIEFTAFQIGGGPLSTSLNDIASGIDADIGSTGSAQSLASPDQLLAAILDTTRVDAVTVNGSPVAALDAAGRFFDPATLAVGDNVFTVTATDAAGFSTTETLTLVGVGPTDPLDTSNLTDGSSGLEVHYCDTTYNRLTDTLHVNTALFNGTGAPIEGPIIDLFDSIDTPAVTVTVPGDETTLSKPSITFDDTDELSGPLAAGATSALVPVAFSNPNEVRFGLENRLLVPQNTAPIFTSIPDTVAPDGLQWNTQLTAFDTESDPLTFTILEAPAAITLSPTGLLEWVPTAADQGEHTIRIEVTDDNGGSATQSFLLSVPAAGTNRAPLILSEPTLLSTDGQTFEYPIFALDPEGASVTLSLEAAPAGMTLVGNTLQWIPTATDVGTHRVTIAASDPDGATSRQSFLLETTPPNTAPVFTTSPVLDATAGTRYTYASVATDADGDAVTYALIAAPNGLTISPNTGRLNWNTQLTDLGSHQVTVTATDARGATVDQSYTLTLTPDTEAPTVAILLSSNLLSPGETVTIRVVADDNVAVDTLSLTVDGNPITLDAEGIGTFTATTPGLPVLEATVTDSSGNVQTATRSLRVIDPADTTPPTITITSPAFGDVITYLTEVTGTIDDADLEFYRIEIALAGTDQFTTVHESNTPVTGGILGTLDPTLLANDIYTLRVSARDFSGNIRREALDLSVEGGAKLGNFRIELTDLTVPLAGIPIQINRVYDSLESAYNQDFGFGWSLDVASPRIRESVRVSEAEAAGAGIFGANPFRIGTRVYLNAPDGQRVGFTFDPIPEPGFLGTIFKPHFVADPGVFHTLEGEDIALQQKPDGTFSLYLTGVSYNPSRYTLVTTDQTRYTYDQFSEIGLESIEDRNEVTLTFDETGIHSSVGPEILWTRDTEGRITEILDTAGNPLTYTYTSSGDLESFTDQVGNVTQMTYLTDPAHYLESITDPRGIEVLSLAYDEAGRLTGQGDALGNNTTQTYDLANNREIIGDRLGNETTLIFDDRGNITEEIDPLGNSTLYQYDADDNEIAITNRRGFTTQFEYDAAGNVTKVTDPLGGETITTYNAANDVLSVTDATGATTTFTYDSLGNQVSETNAEGNTTLWTHDAEGRILTRTDPVGNPWTFEYGFSSEPTKVIDPLGNFRETTQNAIGLFTSYRDENGNTVQFILDAIGRPTQIIDPEGNTTTLVYDDTELVSRTDGRGFTTNYEYDDVGELIAEVDPAGARSEFVLDANGQVTKTIDALGRKTEFQYDELGRLVSSKNALGLERFYAYDENGNLVLETDPLGHQTQFEYDGLDRQTAMVDPASQRWESTYDGVGKRLTFTDPRNATTSWVYDATGLITQRTDALGGVESWGYDSRGNVTSYEGPRGNQTTFVYDDFSRLSSTTDALGFTESYTYDGTGKLLTYTDALGHASTNQYDGNGLLTRVSYPDGGQDAFQYDANGNLTRTIDPLGRATDYRYDSVNRLITSVDPRGATTQFSYDLVGNQLSLTDPVGNQTSWTYDALDRVMQRTDPLGESESYQYDDVGNLTRHTDRIGRARDYDYDILDRLTSETWLDSSGTTVDTLQFSYDAVGNLLSAIDSDSQSTFSYDLLSRLTSQLLRTKLRSHF